MLPFCFSLLCPMPWSSEKILWGLISIITIYFNKNRNIVYNLACFFFKNLLKTIWMVAFHQRLFYSLMENVCKVDLAPWKNTGLQTVMWRASCWKPFNGHWNYFGLFGSCEPSQQHCPQPCILPGVGKAGCRAGRYLEEDRGCGGKSSESSSSKSTLGCYLLIVKRRWITSLGLWQVSWDEKKEAQ